MNPWLKFYPSDWRADPRLRICSLAARGLWIELIGYMHEAEPYGFLTINGIPPSGEDIAALVGRPLAEVRKAMAELASREVFSMSGDKMFSRRMVRDKAKADKDRENGKGGGNPRIVGADKAGVNPPDKAGVNTPDKAQIPEARDQKKDSEANASGAEAPIDHRKRLFSEGLAKLSALTGKGPDACRSFVGKCLKAAGDDAITVLGLIEDAERNQVVNASAWIAARLKPVEIANGTSNNRSGSSLTAEIRRELAELEGPQGADPALPARPVLLISN